MECEIERRFWNKVDKSGDCWLWTASKQHYGYGAFWNGKKLVPAHRWIYQRIHGEFPSSTHICHRCDVPSCVRPDHLFAGTAHDNIRDCISKGRNRIGFRNRGIGVKQSKLNDKSVVEIRKMYKQGWTQVELGKKFGVSHRAIGYVLRRVTWDHVP